MPHDTMTSALEPMLHKMQQWKKLDQKDRQAILDLPFTIEHADPARYIVREGDRPKHSCLLVSGFAFRQKTVTDGARSISAIHMRGDIVDLQNSLLDMADHSVQALTRCKVAFIPREAILEVAFAYPAVGIAMWFDTLVDGSIFREWIANVTRRNATQRIAHILCEVGVRLEAAGLGNKLNYELPMTQEHLADCTGLTPIHVNRTLKALATAGEISRSKRNVAITDWAKITKTADFREAYLHLPQRGLLQ